MPRWLSCFVLLLEGLGARVDWQQTAEQAISIGLG
jgi:hypothetical protein